MYSPQAAAAKAAACENDPTPEERKRRSDIRMRRRKLAEQFTLIGGDYAPGEELAELPEGEFINEEGGSLHGVAGYVISTENIWRVDTLKRRDGSTVLKGWSLPFSTESAKQIREVL